MRQGYVMNGLINLKYLLLNFEKFFFDMNINFFILIVKYQLNLFFYINV